MKTKHTLGLQKGITASRFHLQLHSSQRFGWSAPKWNLKCYQALWTRQKNILPGVPQMVKLQMQPYYL
jgi:hypothetical protein